MEKKKRFIECYIPCSVCNLRCEYCYVIQQNRRNEEIEKTKYSIDHMIKGLTKERLGGSCFFSICAVGETFIPPYIVPLVKGILENGHYVNITNNGTASKRIDEICTLDLKLLKRLHLTFSFHYLELKKQKLLDTFFENINKVKNAGCSFVLKLNLCDSYIEEIEDIKALCLEKIGSLPVVSITRKENGDGTVSLYTKDEKRYIDSGLSFNSKMFPFTLTNFNVKRKEFCYAGDWAFLLNFETGVMSKCYSNPEGAIDIFKDINMPIPFEAVGKHCNNSFCVNADHFLTQGIIPTIDCDGYADIRTDNGRNWYSGDLKDFFNQKLSVNNKKYSLFKKFKINSKYFCSNLRNKISKIYHRTFHK